MHEVQNMYTGILLIHKVSKIATAAVDSNMKRKHKTEYHTRILETKNINTQQVQ